MKKLILVVILLVIIGWIGCWIYKNHVNPSADADQARALDVKTAAARKLSVRPNFSLSLPATISWINTSASGGPTHIEAKFSVRATPEAKRRLILPIKAYVDLVDLSTGETVVPAASQVLTSVAQSGMAEIKDTENGAVVEFTYRQPVTTLTRGKTYRVVIRKFDWLGGSRILPPMSSSPFVSSVTAY